MPWHCCVFIFRDLSFWMPIVSLRLVQFWMCPLQRMWGIMQMSHYAFQTKRSPFRYQYTCYFFNWLNNDIILPLKFEFITSLLMWRGKIKYACQRCFSSCDSLRTNKELGSMAFSSYPKVLWLLRLSSVNIICNLLFSFLDKNGVWEWVTVWGLREQIFQSSKNRDADLPAKQIIPLSLTLNAWSICGSSSFGILRCNEKCLV